MKNGRQNAVNFLSMISFYSICENKNLISVKKNAQIYLNSRFFWPKSSEKCEKNNDPVLIFGDISSLCLFLRVGSE